MSLEANKFMKNILSEAVLNENAQNKKILEQIKANKGKKNQIILADVDLTITDYNFILKILDSINYDLYLP